MSYGEPHHTPQVYDDLSSPVQYREYSNNFYPPLDKYALPEYSSDPYGPESHPPTLSSTRQNSGQLGGASSSADTIMADQHYMLPGHLQHALYPAPSQLEPHPPNLIPQESNQRWSSYDQSMGAGITSNSNMPMSYDSFPSTSPYPPPRLTPPTPTHLNGGAQLHGGPRVTLAGSLDPTTGIFYRTPEHPRLRTAQACEKCRTRKAKCSGEHPSCKRCTSRGLICEYAKEGRVRGPNKPKNKTSGLSEAPRSTSRGRSSSTKESSDRSSSSFVIERPEVPLSVVTALQSHDERMGLPPRQTLRRNSLSLGEHRSDRPRPPNLRLDASSNHFRLEGPRSGDPMSRSEALMQHMQQRGMQASSNGYSHPIHAPMAPALPRSQNHSMPGTSILEPASSHHAFDDSGSNSSSSQAGGHRRQMATHSGGYGQYRDDSCPSDGGSMCSNPRSAVSMTFNHSPTSTSSSPMTATPAMLHYTGHGEHIDVPSHDRHSHLQQRMGTPMSVPLDHIWAAETRAAAAASIHAHPNSHSTPEFHGQYRRPEQREQNIHVNLTPGVSDAHPMGDDHDHLALQYPMDMRMC